MRWSCIQRQALTLLGLLALWGLNSVHAAPLRVVTLSNDSTEAVLALGYLTGPEFDETVRPEKMV